MTLAHMKSIHAVNIVISRNVKKDVYIMAIPKGDAHGKCNKRRV